MTMAIRAGVHMLVNTMPLKIYLQHGVEYLAIQAIEMGVMANAWRQVVNILSNKHISV